VIKVSLIEKQSIWYIAIISPLLFSFLGTLSIFLCIFYLLIKQNKDQFFLKKKELSMVAIYCILFIPIIFFISILSKLLLPEFSEQQQVTDLKANFFEIIKKNGIIIILLAPIVEEIIFRGLFYAALKKNFPWFVSQIISSVIFAIIHENIMAFTLLFSLSLILNLIYELYGKLFYPILVHSFFNTFMLALIYFGNE
jgi:membrane protease YdiL (CAAX protease family)